MELDLYDLYHYPVFRAMSLYSLYLYRLAWGGGFLWEDVLAEEHRVAASGYMYYAFLFLALQQQAGVI